MGRTPCCEKKGLKKGPWTAEEDEALIEYIIKNGFCSWCSLPKHAGLLRCGKSCRLQWTNYLRADIKRGPFSPEEEKLVIQLHGIQGNRWAAIASKLLGRTDNEIKNLWNTHLKKRLPTNTPTLYLFWSKQKTTRPTLAPPATWHNGRAQGLKLKLGCQRSHCSLILRPV